MSTNFYKINGSYYTADTNQKISDLNALQTYAKAGGKEITAPAPKAGSVAIPNPGAIKDYNVTNQVGGTLFGTLKAPTAPSSSDLTTGMNLGSVTPPANTAELVHQTFANNAAQYTQAQKDMFAIADQQLKDTQAKIEELNKQQAENQVNIDKNVAAVKDVQTADMNNPDTMGWRQKALGMKAEDLQSEYDRQKADLATRSGMVDEATQLSQMYANQLAKGVAGTTMSIMTGRENSVKEQYAGRIAALQAGIATLDGNINMARTFIDNGINTVNADRQDQLNYLNFVQGLYNQKSSDTKSALLTATKEEKDAINSQIGILQAKITETENNKKFIQNLFTDTQTAQTAIKAGVSLTDTPDQATQKMTEYLKTAPDPKLDELLSASEIATLGVPFGTTVRQAMALKITPARWKGQSSGGSPVNKPAVIDDKGNVLGPESPDYLLNVIRNSKGGKAVDVAAKQQLSKSINVLGQLSELKTNITGQSTGPILGILRDNNPYDVKAQLIAAQLKAIVPNLARGVYGEVGVLTDNDVALYSKTLPNIKSTEELRNAVLGMTVRTIQRSLETQLEVEASLGRDVSGLENMYQRIKKQADELEKGLSGKTEAPSSQATDYIKSLSIPEEEPKSEGIISKIGSYIKNLFN